MSERLEAFLKLLKENGGKFPQDQGSSTDQLVTICTVANLLGLYDAADVIQKIIVGEKQ